MPALERLIVVVSRFGDFRAATARVGGCDTHVEQPTPFRAPPRDACRVGAGAKDALRQMAELRSELEQLAADEVTAARAAWQLARRKLEAWDVESEAVFHEIHGERLRLEAQLALMRAGAGGGTEAPEDAERRIADALADVARREDAALKARLAGREGVERDARIRAASYLRAGSRLVGLLHDSEMELRALVAAGEQANRGLCAAAVRRAS